MLKSIFIFASLVVGLTLSAQNEKNYILEINGDSVSLSLNETTVIKTKDGQTLRINLKQKEVLTYSDDFMSFKYPAAFTMSKKSIDDIDQILCMSGGGNGFIIQKYKSINPENLVDVMMDEMTEESKDAGYKETKILVEKVLASGRVIKGKQSTLVLDDETNIYSVYSAKIKKGGIMIVMLLVNPEDEKEVASLDILWKTLETKN